MRKSIVSPGERFCMAGEKTAENKQNVVLAAVLLGVAAYFVLFCAARLPSYEERLGPAPDGGDVVFRRMDFVRQVALLPDKELLPAWFGSPPQFSILDRVPVLLVAGGIIFVALVRLAEGIKVMRMAGSSPAEKPSEL